MAFTGGPALASAAPPLLAVAAFCTLLAPGVAPGQVPPAGCLAPDTIADDDFARHLLALADPSLCISERGFSENGVDWRLFVVRNTTLPGPLWAVPHDDEDAAFATGVGAVLRYGGVMVAVENDDNRVNAGQDPNQIFATAQAAADTCPGATAPAPLYVAAYLNEWDRAYPAIGLHSNWDGFLAGGGLGTISVRRQDDKMIPFPSPVAEGRFADEDTLVMLVSARPPTENRAGRATVGWLNDRGAHVIYRHVTEENNECTLADYLTLNRLGPYFNLEVEHGDAVTQAALLDLLMEFVASPAYRGML